MILDSHQEVSLEEAKRDFDIHYIGVWATLLGGYTMHLSAQKDIIVQEQKNT